MNDGVEYIAASTLPVHLVTATVSRPSRYGAGVEIGWFGAVNLCASTPLYGGYVKLTQLPDGTVVDNGLAWPQMLTRFARSGKFKVTHPCVIAVDRLQWEWAEPGDTVIITSSAMIAYGGVISVPTTDFTTPNMGIPPQPQAGGYHIGVGAAYMMSLTLLPSPGTRLDIGPFPATPFLRSLDSNGRSYPIRA